MTKTIKISKSNYERLNRYAGMMRVEGKKPVSMNEALSTLLLEKRRKKLTDFAGSWVMSKEESERIKKHIRAVWKTWKI